MISVRFGVGTKDLNGLKGQMYSYGLRRIGQFYSPDGLVWLYSYLDPDIKKFSDVVNQIRSQNAAPEERGWADNLQNLVNYLGEMKELLSKENNLPPTERDKVEMQMVLGLTEKLERLVEGYFNDRDPDCPACPTHKPSASWENWKERNSLRNWLNKVSRIPWEKSQRGISYPSSLIRD